VVVFAARFVVQRVLYDTNHEGWLVVARIAMGWPLAALAALVTFLAIRVAQRALDGLGGDGLEGVAVTAADVGAVPLPPR
jgi:hypothetical protein